MVQSFFLCFIKNTGIDVVRQRYSAIDKVFSQNGKQKRLAVNQEYNVVYFASGHLQHLNNVIMI